MRWSCGILIMHCFVHLHGTFKAHCRRSWHFFPARPFHNLYGGVLHVSLSKLEIAVEYQNKEYCKLYTSRGNILELLLTRHCFHGVMISSMGVSANQHAVTSTDNTCTSRCANVMVYYIRISLHDNRIYWYVSCIIRFLCLYLKVEIVR